MRFSDPIDQGSHLAEMHTQSSIENHRWDNKPQQEKVLIETLPNGDEVWDWPTKECIDCDDPIGQIRLELGRIRCVSCQSNLEERAKKYGKK